MIYASPSLLLPLIPLLSISASQKTLKHECATGTHIISGHAHTGGFLGPQLGSIIPPALTPPNQQTQPPEGYGELFPLFGKIKRAIPGSDNYTVPYNSYGTVEFPREVYGSTTNIMKAVVDYATSCPDTPIILAGYSEGAVAVSNVLCGTTSVALVPTAPIAAEYQKNIIAVVLYGDESRPANQPYDRGGCKTSGPLVRLDPAACDPFVDKIRSYCYLHDAYCCVGGTSRQAHYIYESMFTDVAARFAISKYEELSSS